MPAAAVRVFTKTYAAVRDISGKIMYNTGRAASARDTLGKIHTNGSCMA